MGYEGLKGRQNGDFVGGFARPEPGQAVVGMEPEK